MAEQAVRTAGTTAIEHRLLEAALFAGCLPVETVRWLKPRRKARPSPFRSALDAAREAAGHAFSLPG